jgi:hypothetical protein
MAQCRGHNIFTQQISRQAKREIADNSTILMEKLHSIEVREQPATRKDDSSSYYLGCEPTFATD